MTQLDRIDTKKTSEASNETSPAIAFALLSSESTPIPSTRIACLNLFPFLEAEGFDPHVVWAPEIPCETPDFPNIGEIIGNRRPAVIVFQKIRGPSVITAIRAARRRRIRTIWCTCDVVDNDMVREADATITVTDFLRSLYAPELHDKIHVVHDGIENAELMAKDVTLPRALPRAVLITSHELYALPTIGASLPLPWTVEIVGRYAHRPLERLKRLYWACNAIPAKQILSIIHTVCSPFVRHTPWSPSSNEQAISQAQIGIIPVDTSDGSKAHGCQEPSWRVKSENRLTLLMAAGLPVIATPIPAYEAIIENGVNGYFARTADDWRSHLRRLRDADFRAEMGNKARTSVHVRYSMPEQARRFIDILQLMVEQNDRPVAMSVGTRGGTSTTASPPEE